MDLNLCRVCICPSTNLEEMAKYADKFFVVTGIKVEDESHLCSNCISRLDDAFAFREQALSANRVLELQKSDFVKYEPLEQTEVKLDAEDLNFDLKDENFDFCEFPQDSEIEGNRDESETSTRQSVQVKSRGRKKKHTVKALEKRPRMVGCPYCFKVDFLSIPEKEIHIQEHINAADGLRCDICDSESQKYFSKRGLTRHMQVVHLKAKITEKKSLSCPECGKNYESAFNLTTHLRIIHQIGPQMSFCCEICGKSYNRQKTLKDHVKLVHQKIKTHECEICHKKFADSHALKTHKLIHDNIRNHVCPICQKAFIQKGNLMEHIESHNQIPKFPCDICGKLYRTSRLLQKHLNSHAIHRFECNVCGQKFKMRAYLKGHMVTHSDRRDFFCEYCHKGFKTKEILKTHVRLHTGENMQECTECGKKYPDQFKLKLHINVAHRGMRFECDICGRVYSTQFGVTRHKQTDHKAT